MHVCEIHKKGIQKHFALFQIDDMLLDIAFQTNVVSKSGASIEQLMTTSGVQKSSIETLQSTGAAATGALKSSPERRVTSKPKLVTNDELALVPRCILGKNYNFRYFNT